MRARPSRARSPAADLAAALERTAAEARAKAYPLTKYAADPVAYVRERLREPHVMAHQAAMLEALARGVAGLAPARVACRSGQKVGKTKTIVWAALWFYETQAGARVFLCAAIIEQTRNVLWRELGDTLRAAEGRGAVVDGKLAASPAGGFVSLDGSREIRGVSGREIEAVAGLSGNMLTCIDEASHLPEDKAQAFAGNTMGGGALFFTSNPTRNAGPFFDAFHAARPFWQTFHVDAEKVARWQEEHGIRIPYTATLAKIDEFRQLYGEDSPFWALRVKGEWLRNEAGRINPMARIVEAAARWSAAPDEGELSIGYDPAGADLERGDEHAWAVVRGSKCLAIHRRRGLDEDQAVNETRSILNVYRRDGETPRVLVDCEGPIGAPIAARLGSEARARDLGGQRGDRFKCIPVKASSRFVRARDKFDRVRDELFWNLAQWLKTGAIPPNDAKLEADLYFPQWETLPDGRVKATSKEKLRDLLGNRSPDSGDALALAVHVPGDWVPDLQAAGAPGGGGRQLYTSPDDSAWAWKEDADTGGAQDQSAPFWPEEEG
ncbi:MAG: hypothetical protein ACRENE_25840 [Polyangiaceae bacterium]